MGIKCNLVSKNVPFHYNLVFLNIVKSRAISVNRLHLVCGCNEHFLQARKENNGYYSDCFQFLMPHVFVI